MIIGLDNVIHKLTRLQGNTPDAMERALMKRGEWIGDESYERAPWKTNNMRDTKQVGPAERTEKQVRVPISYGGPKAPYTIYVHEDLEALHPHGQAKFLESVIREAQPHMAEELAKDIKLEEMIR